MLILPRLLARCERTRRRAYKTSGSWLIWWHPPEARGSRGDGIGYPSPVKVKLLASRRGAKRGCRKPRPGDGAPACDSRNAKPPGLGFHAVLDGDGASRKGLARVQARGREPCF